MQRQSSAQMAFNFAVLLGVLAVLAGTGWLIHEAIKSNSAVLGAALTAFAAVLAVVANRVFERQGEGHKVRREHLAPVYEDLVHQFTTAAQAENSESLEALFTTFQRKALIWAPGKLITAFLTWRSTIPDAPGDIAVDVAQFLAFEEFFKEMRSGIGTSNSGVAEGDLMRVLINDFDEHYALYKSQQAAKRGSPNPG